MTCQMCGDRGIFEVCYRNGDPSEFAICSCRTGQAWRVDQNAGRTVNPMWHIWAARRGVSHDRVHPIDEWPELAAQLVPAAAQRQGSSLDDALVAAGRTRKGPRL